MHRLPIFKLPSIRALDKEEMQELLRAEFSQLTLLTIAHRLQTIIEYEQARRARTPSTRATPTTAAARHRQSVHRRRSGYTSMFSRPPPTRCSLWALVGCSRRVRLCSCCKRPARRSATWRRRSARLPRRISTRAPQPQPRRGSSHRPTRPSTKYRGVARSAGEISHRLSRVYLGNVNLLSRLAFRIRSSRWLDVVPE